MPVLNTTPIAHTNFQRRRIKKPKKAKTEDPPFSSISHLDSYTLGFALSLRKRVAFAAELKKKRLAQLVGKNGEGTLESSSLFAPKYYIFIAFSFLQGVTETRLMQI